MTAHQSPLFSIVTGTYNRATLLPRVHESLVQQTLRDFEWIVVDDGSTDDTAAVVARLAEQSPFPVVYVHKPNGGWHTAFNRAVAIARGKYVNLLDSDDWYPPHALSRFAEAWSTIPTDERNRFAAVVGLCAYASGQVIASPFPTSPLDCSHLDLRFRHGLQGDRAFSFRTEVLPSHLFPEDGSEFYPNSLLLNRLSTAYVSRHFNEVVKHVEYQPDGLTATILAIRVASAAASGLYHRELAILTKHRSLAGQLRAHINFSRFAFHEGLSLRAQARLAPSLAQWLLSVGPGRLAATWDNYRLRRARHGAVAGKPAIVDGRLVRRTSHTNASIKRMFDVLVASVALILLSPLLVLVALLVRLLLGTPVLFRQRRPGRDGRLFTIYKFRTMVDGPDDVPDADRLTRFGKLLRASSLDELPELFNVIAGDMSLVGPRPLLLEYLSLYTPEQSRRHEVRPGITGWAQINGRNALTWERKLSLDVWYVDNCSFLLDLRILAMTVGRVLTRQGITQAGHATTSRFRNADS